MKSTILKAVPVSLLVLGSILLYAPASRAGSYAGPAPFATPVPGQSPVVTGQYQDTDKDGRPTEIKSFSCTDKQKQIDAANSGIKRDDAIITELTGYANKAKADIATAQNRIKEIDKELTAANMQKPVDLAKLARLYKERGDLYASIDRNKTLQNSDEAYIAARKSERQLKVDLITWLESNCDYHAAPTK